jgi:ATP-dependent RNA helicase HelY
MEYRGFSLDRFQIEAIEALQAKKSVLVAAPTGTGKTLVADWIVDSAMSNGQSVIYTAPIKALSNQKYRDYCALFGTENVGLVTGDLVIRRDAPCKVMTTEILRNMLLGNESFDNLAAVIIDEIHFLDDPERGTTWEEVLIYLPQHVLIVGLSATLSNLQQFAEWLGYVRNREVVVVEECKRAVPLTFQIATHQTNLRSIKKTQELHKEMGIRKPKPKKYDPRKRRKFKKEKSGIRETTHIDVFHMLGEEAHPYLYFVFSRAKTESLAFMLSRHIGHSLLSKEEQEQVQAHIDRFMEDAKGSLALTKHLKRLYRDGIAFHHAGLHVLLKNLVEELYEKKLIRVLYCTGTFALGINMPARAAVLDGLERYNGQGMIELPTREFMQMAGRAGRRGMDDEGLVVMRMNLEEFPDMLPRIERYMAHRYEPVHSRFSLSFNSAVNLLHHHPIERIQQLVERSFLSWYRNQEAEECVREATEMEQALIKSGFDVDVVGRLPKGVHQKNKQVRKLRRRAEYSRGQSWKEFEQRIIFLQRWHYIKEDRTFNTGAKALMYFQIQEMFTTELFLEGIFDSLPPSELYGVLCGMVVELPRNVHVSEKRKYRGISRRILAVLHTDIVQEAAAITKQPLVWEPAMIPIGKAWAEGQSLEQILDALSYSTDVSGTLVGAFRRAKDLCMQLKNAWSDFPGQREVMHRLLKSVSRDEVEVVA